MPILENFRRAFNNQFFFSDLLRVLVMFFLHAENAAHVCNAIDLKWNLNFNNLSPTLNRFT